MGGDVKGIAEEKVKKACGEGEGAVQDPTGEKSVNQIVNEPSERTEDVRHRGAKIQN